VTGAFLRPRRFATIFRRKVSVVKQLVTRAMNAPKGPPPPAIAEKAMTHAIDTTLIISPYSTICAPSSSRPQSTARLLIATKLIAHV